MNRLRATWSVVLIWLLSCAIATYRQVNTILGDSGPSDVCDKTWAYQLLVFCGARLPYWFLGLALVLIAIQLGTKGATSL